MVREKWIYQNKMAQLAMIVSIIAIAMCMFGYIALPAAGVGLMLAVLSRGADGAMPSQSKVALSLSIVSIVLSLLVTAMALYMLFFVPAVRDQINTLYSQRYGMSFDEMLQQVTEVYGQ